MAVIDVLSGDAGLTHTRQKIDQRAPGHILRPDPPIFPALWTVHLLEPDQLHLLELAGAGGAIDSQGAELDQIPYVFLWHVVIPHDVRSIRAGRPGNRSGETLPARRPGARG